MAAEHEQAFADALVEWALALAAQAAAGDAPRHEDEAQADPDLQRAGERVLGDEART